MKNNSALKTLYLYNSIFVFAANLIGPLFAVYILKFNNSAITISLTWAIFLTFTTIFTYIFSKFGDRLAEQEYWLLIGFIIRAISWFLYIFAGYIYLIFGIQILLALGEAIGSPAFDTILAKHVDCGSQMSEYSLWKVISNLSTALAAIIGGIIVNYFGFSTLFFIMFILALIAFFGILTKPRKLL